MYVKIATVDSVAADAVYVMKLSQNTVKPV